MEIKQLILGWLAALNDKPLRYQIFSSDRYSK